MTEVSKIVLHTDSLDCECAECKIHFWQQIEDGAELKQVIKKIASEHYKCDICMTFFSDAKSLEDHRITNHWSRYQCVLCKASYSKKQSYDKHCRKSHHGDISSDYTESKAHVNPQPISEFIKGTGTDFIQKYKCNFCTAIFSCMKFANKHAEIVHKMSAQNTYTELNAVKELSNIHHIDSDEEVHACNLCSETFSDDEMLMNHKKTEHNIRFDVYRNKCKICGKVCSTSYNLRLHMTIHTTKNRLKCFICKKVFTHRSSLNTHMAIVHMKQRKYKCKFCPSTYATGTQLSSHTRIHTGERPFECETCGKAFRGKKDLTKHERLHSGVKSHHCDYCDKKFYDIKHKRVHERTHTGERPYECEICNKAFSQLNSMKRHLVTHTGEKPYKCDICGQGFTQGCSVERHKVSHSKKES